MKPHQIPGFISLVMFEIQSGIDMFNEHSADPKASYPLEIDIHLSVEKEDEHHDFWVKVPFKRPQ